MKKLFLILGILIAQCTINMAQVPTLLPDYPITKGVSAPFAGFIKNWLIVGGGCNFPTIPAAEGGKKAYYNQCYALDIHATSPRWKRISDLPCSVAYGCSVETPQGLVCIGGMNADSCLTSVFRIQKDSSSEDFLIYQLPSLPETIDNASATMLNKCIYITGGNQQLRQNALYKLDLKTCDKWQKLSSFPGPQRVQPILVNDGKKLYLIGGFQAPSDSSASILLLGSDTDVVGIDEAQFFDENLIDVCNELANRGTRVIVAGLDLDFKGVPFGPMPGLCAVADEVTKVHAICVRCGALAYVSHRTVDDEKRVLLGEQTAYEPLCRACYQKAIEKDNLKHQV